ncbi:MAG: DUF424 family protein [Methanosarcinaceae archaeon]|nr:DUF424 family protein [Methanosarcinaceae archaeon]MDF1533656.1 DUF424 family protein [Methanosarcinaceae archaeon]
MHLKIHKSGTSFIVAVCDKDLLGKKLKQGNTTVDISEEFYKGDIVSEEQIIEVLTNATTANLFGERAVACAIKCGFVDPECVIIINGVPHAQIFCL